MPVLDPIPPEDNNSPFFSSSEDSNSVNRLDIAARLSLTEQFVLARMMQECDLALNLSNLPQGASHIQFEVSDLRRRSERLKELITLLYEKSCLQQKILTKSFKASLGCE